MKNRYLPFALALGLSSFLTLAVQAQEQPAAAPANEAQHRQIDPARQAHNMAKKLGLSADQESKLVPILTERNQQRMAIFSDSSLSQQDRHAKMQTLRQDSDAKIKSVLTEDQKQKYDELKQEMHSRRQHS